MSESEHLNQILNGSNIAQQEEGFHELYCVQYTSSCYQNQLELLRKSAISNSELLCQTLQNRLKQIAQFKQKVNKNVYKFIIVWSSIIIITSLCLLFILKFYFSQSKSQLLKAIVVIEWAVLIVLIEAMIIWHYRRKCRKLMDYFYSKQSMTDQLEDFLRKWRGGYGVNVQMNKISSDLYQNRTELVLESESGRRAQILIIDPKHNVFSVDTQYQVLIQQPQQ